MGFGGALGADEPSGCHRPLPPVGSGSRIVARPARKAASRSAWVIAAGPCYSQTISGIGPKLIVRENFVRNVVNHDGAVKVRDRGIRTVLIPRESPPALVVHRFGFSAGSRPELRFAATALLDIISIRREDQGIYSPPHCAKKPSIQLSRRGRVADGFR